MTDSLKTPAAERVCAVVVTFNRRELLRECLRALEGQQRPVDHILVIDNASTDGTGELLDAEFPGVENVRLEVNGGGSGGFHEGVKRAYAQGYDWMWLMDDDGIPNPDCLQLLMEKAVPGACVLPVQQGREGKHGILGWKGGRWLNLDHITKIPIGYPEGTPALAPKDLLFTFVGPLISRAVVKRVGLPHGGFFIWFDDFEYAFRIRRLMKPNFIVVPDAIFHHDPAISWRQVRLLGIGKPKRRYTWAIWRGYYMSRNSLYTLTRTHKRWPDTLVFLASQVRSLLAILLYDPDRWPRAGALLRGLFDGALGRMGRRH